MTELARRKAAREIISNAGYGKLGGHFRKAHGGESDEASDRRMVESGVRQHETHQHPGQGHTKLRLQDGGVAMGPMERSRHDRAGRKGNGKAPKVNITIHSSPHDQPPMLDPQRPPPVIAPPGPPRPVPVPMGGGLPMGAGPGGPMPMPMGMRPMKRGGRAGGGEVGPGTKHMTAGSGSGAGRLEKSRGLPY